MISISPRLERLLLRAGLLHASKEEAARQLARAADTLYTTRDYESLEEVARILAGMSTPQAEAAGAYYLALCELRRGQEVAAARLLQSVVSQKAAPRYQARATHAFGVINRFAGDTREAFRLYDQAIKQASAANSADLLTFVNAALARSEIISAEGDHERALDELRAVKPAVEIVAQVHPVYAPMLANEIAFELLQTGRIEDARNFALYALASPLVSRFPNWTETAGEIEQAREAIAAHKSILRVEVRSVRSTARKRTLRTLFLIQKLALKASRRRSQPRTAVFTRELPRIRPTLEQVSLKIKIRAPSF